MKIRTEPEDLSVPFFVNRVGHLPKGCLFTIQDDGSWLDDKPRWFVTLEIPDGEGGDEPNTRPAVVLPCESGADEPENEDAYLRRAFLYVDLPFNIDVLAINLQPSVEIPIEATPPAFQSGVEVIRMAGRSPDLPPGWEAPVMLGQETGCSVIAHRKNLGEPGRGRGNIAVQVDEWNPRQIDFSRVEHLAVDWELVIRSR